MSSKSFSNTIRLVSYLIGVLMLAQVVLMFIPYYTNGDGATTSIQGYVWTQYNTFKAYFTEKIQGYNINSEVGAPILILVLGVAGIIMNAFFPEKIRALVLSVAYAIAGIWGFATTASLKLGGMYTLHLILVIVVAVLAVLNVVQYVLESRSRIKA